jgi:hypothetical protein
MNIMKHTRYLLVLWGLITMVTTGMERALAAERALDLAEPTTIAMIIGRYEGQWVDHRSHRRGSVAMTISANPHGGEKPFVREARFVGSATLDPKKASVMAGKVERNTLVFVHTSGWSQYTFYEDNGQIKARGEYRSETGPMIGSEGAQELVRVGEATRMSAQKPE